ncbi:DUF4097 family beta strand repeat-containing protein [Psychrobacillus sp. L3]|uniref:DUF4097 family beta strand repeat-containing protein n=1 Tax=Psychrobacillus sp. L3 TaxID=3236891 RepID=UPI0036F2C45D
MGIKKIAIISLFILLAGVAVSIILNVKDALVNKSDEIIVEDNSFTNIHILSDNALVEIIPTKNEATKAKFSGKMKKKSNYNFHADVKGDTLVVELKEKRWSFIQFGLTSHDIKLKVYVPEQNYSKLKTEIDNGRIVAENMNVKNMELETDNGSIELKNINSESVFTKTDNGQILMDNVEGKLKAETDNGRIVLITNNLERSIDFKADNGLLQIQTDKEPSNATIQAKVDVGSVHIFGKTKTRTIFGDGVNLINLEIDNGKIIVKKSY